MGGLQHPIHHSNVVTMALSC